MKSLLITLGCLLPALGYANAESDARAALAFAMTDKPKQEKPSFVYTYAKGYAISLRTGKPLIVWVGQPAQAVDGCIAVEEKEFPDCVGPCVILSMPKDGKLMRIADLAGKPEQAAIREVLFPPKQISAFPESPNVAC